MKVALVHSYYSSRQPSGENVVVDAQAQALRDSGVDARIIALSTDELESKPGYKLRSAFNVASGHGPSPLAELASFRPDVVHVHNLFPNWGATWLDAWTGPIVATVHNFRPVCSAGTLFRAGEVCTLCPDGAPFQAIRHACYRDSKLATVPLALKTRRGASGDPLLARADRVILLSPRARRLYTVFGLSDNKTTVIPNFVTDRGFSPLLPPGKEWLYIGRLTQEKGILNLLKHWPPNEVLNIYGDGPLRPQVESAVSQNVRYLGYLHHDEIPKVLGNSGGLVFPSEWAEGLPLVYAETLASGRPVVAKSGNSAADDVENAGVGRVFDSWEELGEAVDVVNANRVKFGLQARSHFEEAFAVDTWLQATVGLYESLIGQGQVHA